MTIFKYLSIKSLIVGISVSYVIPAVISVGYVNANYVEYTLTTFESALMLLWLFCIAPFFCGYLAAKYSSQYSIENGVTASFLAAIGLIIISTNILFLIYAVFLFLSVVFGYLGARKYVGGKLFSNKAIQPGRAK